MIKKIGVDFIRQQDLVIVGLDGLSKLMCTPLQWKDSLPSTLIIKEKKQAENNYEFIRYWEKNLK